jgi:hypothetical protein
MKFVNIRQFAWLLRQISKAIQDKDLDLFEEHFRMLDKAGEAL